MRTHFVNANGNLDNVEHASPNRRCYGGLSLPASFNRLRTNGNLTGLPRYARYHEEGTREWNGPYGCKKSAGQGCVSSQTRHDAPARAWRAWLLTLSV